MNARNKPLIDVAAIARFWANVHKTPKCWLWIGGKHNQRGYGRINVAGRKTLVHRFAFEICHGRAPNGVLRHRCDNTQCVRPEHLLEGTQLDNMREASERNRMAHGERHPRARLTSEQVDQIRALRERGWSTREIAPLYAVHHSYISRICTRAKRRVA